MAAPFRFSLCLFLAAGCLSATPPTPTDQELILGTWVSAKDKSWKLVFTKDKCTQYYSGEGPKIEVDSYTLSNKSPQCGTTVPVDNYTSYLQLTNRKNHLTSCFEVTSLDTHYLAYRPVNMGGVMLFTRKR